ncbi:MAG: DUF2461 domain-containing protein [Defluviitaleaceae bacterium]|nr:DUF2461 domain-containing protein [Defluviitaleaceae bacterium]
MFTGFTPQTIDFMWNLRFNNNREWFEANKSAFIQDFQTPMKALAQDVFSQISASYPKHGFIHKVSRIYKDARRIRDGEPYRCNLWFSIERPSEEWTTTPVFWFELAPENWRYGLGYYQAKPLTMMKFRARIDRDPAKFEKLIVPLAKQGEFVLDGDEYKRVKVGPTAKTEAWYNKKSILLDHEQQNGKELYSADLADRLVAGYKFLMPFYDYFITLDGDADPRELVDK